MKLFRCFVLFLAMAFTAVGTAAPPYATKRLARIADAVGLHVPDGVVMGMDDDTTWNYRGKQLRVRTNAFGEVSHVGYKLFSRQVIEAYRSLALLNFLERYALELDLRLDGRSPSQRLSLDKVVCIEGNMELLAQVKENTPFSIEEIERRMYHVGWKLGNHKVSLTFPANCQLILGADARELEDIFERNIRRTEPLSDKEALAPWSSAKTYQSDGNIIAEGGQFLSKLIRSDLYFTKQKDARYLLTDPRRPIQATSNLLLTGISNQPTPLKLTLNRYGYRTTQSDVTLQQFVSLCHKEGDRLYVGVKTHAGQSVKATLFALNNKLAYCHVLSVEIPLGLLSGKDEVIKGTAYVYIPLENVTEDFFTKNLK